MADPRLRWSDNDPAVVEHEGRRVSFYVDQECIVCTVCAEHAPDNFGLSETEDHDVCFRQPRSAEELAACYAALADCPVEAIGDDGHVGPADLRSSAR